MLVMLIGTPAPMPVPPLEVVAAPSAIAWPSTLASDCTVSAPVAVMWRPAGIDAVDDPFSMLTATAPATLTDLSEVDAEGELSPFVPLGSVPLALPPAFVWCVFALLSAKPFWLATLLSTLEFLLSSVFESSSSSPPAALDSALLSLHQIAL